MIAKRRDKPELDKAQRRAYAPTSASPTMPIGEFIGEVILRGLLEVVFYPVAYFTGAVFLSVLTLGRMQIAPFSTIGETNRKKTKWNDRSIWLYRPMRRRVLKADFVCLIGLCLWITLLICLGLIFSAGKEDAKEAERGPPASRSVPMVFPADKPKPAIQARPHRSWCMCSLLGVTTCTPGRKS